MSWLPQTRKDWLEDQGLYRDIPNLLIPEDEVLRRNVNWLIEQCYEPDAEIGAGVTDRRLKQLGLWDSRKEAINWGDLSCVSVKQFVDDSWEVVLEEASSDSSVLCHYIWDWLTKWGWKVNVRTEW